MKHRKNILIIAWTLGLVNFKRSTKRNILRPGKLLAVGSCLLFALTNNCMDPYNPKATDTDVKYLVVDGVLKGPHETTNIFLSRTATLATSSSIVPEKNAVVQIESSDGTKYTLNEKNPGTYSADSLPVGIASSYRVTILTADNKNYASDFVQFKPSPPIDSVHWTADDQNLHVFVNTHDDENATQYYLWNYRATWSYHSAWRSTIKLEDGKIIQRDLSDNLYNCWRTIRSTEILIASTARLTRDVISDREVIVEPLTSQKLQSEYSVLVEQLALTEAAYNYWQELKKNTENLGTLFGPQPSTLVSNIHSLTSVEPVLGYFSAGSATQYRIIITYDELPPSRHDTGYEACVADTLFLNQVSNFGGSETLINEVFKGIVLIGYLKSTDDCVDCTHHGGTTVKPDYWK